MNAVVEEEEALLGWALGSQLNPSSLGCQERKVLCFFDNG